MRLTCGDIRLYCELTGQGPPVLFVHGFPLDGRMWRATAAGLGDRCRCIVPDQRGLGRSDVSDVTSIEQLADDLALLLDTLDERRPVVLVGLSMGGVVAFEFFRRHRARLRALGLIDARPTPEPPEGKPRREAVAQAALTQGSRAVADQMIENVLAPGVSPAVRAAVYEMMLAAPPRGVAAAARALANRADSQSTLAEIDLPTLIVVGVEDRITPPDVARGMHERIAGSRLVVVPGAGHIPPMERPEEFNRALGEFVEQLPSGAG